MSGHWPDEPVPSRQAGRSQKRPPRWGLRTLGFLGLALVAIITSASLGGHTFGTLGSLIFGLVGAGYCSVKGFRASLQSEAFHMLWDRDQGR